jgi:hypothetical protein
VLDPQPVHRSNDEHAIVARVQEPLADDAVGLTASIYMLRTTHQHHVQLSAMADLKANILITISSIVLTLSIRQFGDSALRPSLLVLAGFTLVALVLAILAVLPKYRPTRLEHPGANLPSQFNLLFFGHFAELPRDRFLREIASALRNDGSVYWTMAKDIYGLGWYLSHHKYRYLRLSYLFFLAGFVAACVVFGVRLVLG